MCRDQDLISETDGRTYGRTYVRTDVRMKIEKPGVGRPPLGPAKTKEKPKIMNVTPSRQTLSLSLDKYFSSFVIYFDNKSYMFERLIIFGNIL